MQSTSRLFAFAAVALSLVMSAPVEAQGGRRGHERGEEQERGRGRGHGHRHGPVVRVTNYAPASGGPGTRVTIHGAGFTPQTSVRLGGRNVRVESVQPNALTFVISRGDRSGPIVLRYPGGPDIQVGSFTIANDPTITSVTAGRRRIGTRIDISGDGFQPGDQIEVGRVALQVVRVTPRRITATLTPGVSTGRLTLVRQGRRYDSGVVVEVEAPAPVLQSIQPASGTPGTRVRLSIANLDPSVRVFFGRTALPALATGPNWIDVQIPANARRGDVLTLRHRQGTSAGQRFELAQPLAVRTVAATASRGGVQLTIDGSGFGPGAQVSVGGITGRVTSVSATRIVAILPGSVPIASPVVVQQGGRSAASPRPLSAYRR